MAILGTTAIHLISYLLGLHTADTQLTDEELNCLKEFSRGKRNLVEIGVFEGATTRVLAEGLEENSRLHAIDPFIPGRLGICWSRLVAKSEINRSSRAHQVTLLEKYSHEAVENIPSPPDFVFVDGDHSLEGITQDWADWADFVEPGGIVALHDTQVPAHNPRVSELGSHQYFESHIRHDERYQLVRQVDSLSILERKRQAS